MRRLFPALSVLSLLAACGTPQEQCINRNTRDLRTVTALIGQVQGNIDRGYAIEEYTVAVPVWDECVVRPATDTTPVVTRPCLDTAEETRTRPQAIDLNAERAKLESLLAKRDQLSREAEGVIAQCRAQYPE